MSNSHPGFVIVFSIKWTTWYWEESLVWLEVFVAERCTSKEGLMIGTLRHFQKSFLTTSILVPLSPFLSLFFIWWRKELFLIFSHFIMSCSEEFQGIILGAMLFGISTPSSCFAELLPAWKLNRLFAEWNIRFWVQSLLVCSLKSLFKRLPNLLKAVTIIPDTFGGVTLV